MPLYINGFNSLIFFMISGDFQGVFCVATTRDLFISPFNGYLAVFFNKKRSLDIKLIELNIR